VSRCSNMRMQKPDLLDHLVGASEQSGWYGSRAVFHSRACRWPPAPPDCGSWPPFRWMWPTGV